MIYILGGVALLALIFGPSLWVKSVLARYSGERSDYPGTGGEFARHLLDQAGLGGVPVEEARGGQIGDHYDPIAKAVRLTPDKLNGRSLTAVVVAAHEVGHALQDRDGYRPLRQRGSIVRAAAVTDRLSSLAILGLSVFGGLAVSPHFLLIGGALIVLAGLVRVVATLITLPVELDASFNRALPLLGSGYLPEEDEGPARRILKAAAVTYLAGALVSMLNLFRLFRAFR
ncbi:MAG: zinc metallopeptidase [Alphaproteobacteria bacterium]|nr:zinc metallopeptidase [Alphaproteobacteria bacterium]